MTSDDLSIAEQAHFNARYASFGEVPADSWRSFRDSITPAHLPGGSSAGLVNLRAYMLLLTHGVASSDVLDYACGVGKWAVHLAGLGARVSGFDLSSVGIERARRRAAASGVSVDFVCADAASLPYESASFDISVGIQALHHTIKYPGTNDELHRVLRPGGIAVFTENLAHNPLIQLARRFTMEDEAGDVLLREPLIRSWARDFAEVHIEPYNLTTMLKRIEAFAPLLPFLQQVDDAVLELLPALRRYCGECVIVLRR